MVPAELMKAMTQLSLAETGFLPKAGKQTRKVVFLAEMETMVPWSSLEASIEPFYSKRGNGRPPMPLGTMLRTYFSQQLLYAIFILIGCSCPFLARSNSSAYHCINFLRSS